jgi:hypothetical protein
MENKVATLKPFNLQSALDGAPVVNGYGTPVTLTKLAIRYADYELLSQDSSGVALTYHRADGTTGGPPFSKYNLYMASVEKKVWVNLYPNGLAFYSASETEANKHANIDRIGKAHPLTYTE